VKLEDALEDSEQRAQTLFNELRGTVPDEQLDDRVRKEVLGSSYHSFHLDH
jgi:hypothetical protein